MLLSIKHGFIRSIEAQHATHLRSTGGREIEITYYG
jgi:hypothetical protein